jgi:hypothetical protein
VTKLKEQHQLYHPEKPAVAEYPIYLCHHIQLNDTSILAKEFRLLGWIVKDALEIEVNNNNMKTENGFPLGCLCKSPIHTWKGCKEILRTEYMCPLDLTLCPIPIGRENCLFSPSLASE